MQKYGVKTAAYAASKHALLGYTNALRLELMGSGVIVTSVNPGPMQTAFFDHADPGGHYQKALGSFWLTDPEALATSICAAFHRSVREINRPRLMEAAARLYRAGAVLEAALEESWGGRLLDRAPALEESATAVVRDGARRNEKEA